jgi:hypothetical protein
MKVLLKEYNMVRSCTNKDCNNYHSGSLMNGRSEVADVMDIFGEPEKCNKCGMGVLAVKRASFTSEKKLNHSPISREFRYLVKCNKCNIAWTATRLTPLNLNDIGTLEFLKSASVDGLKCRGCKSNTNLVLLQASEL